jgi:hypothetical protein
MMITRRQFFATLLVFLIMLLLFMGFQLGKSAVNASAANQHIRELPTSDGTTRRETGFTAADALESLPTGEEWALYLGRDDSEYAATVKEWAYYSGFSVVRGEELPTEEEGTLPGLVMIEPEFVQGRAGRIAKLMKSGVDFLFLSLPDQDNVASSDTLREILGIYRVIRPSVTLQGVHLFEGFLLGGERIFTAEEGGARQDLELTIPWYSVRTGTKTFMRGILSDEELSSAKASKLKNEDMPAVLWRNHYGAGEAYAVNGEYLKNRRIGLGILQAVMHQRREYLIYPVINAQVFSVVGFPMLTDVNRTEVESAYGRTAMKMQSDIMIPMFITLAAKYDARLSCFLSVSYDGNEPQKGLLASYLSMIGEMEGELGWSPARRERVSPEETAAEDWAFLQSEIGGYRIASAAASQSEARQLPKALADAGMQDIRTVCLSDYSEELPIVGYLHGEITYQQATSALTEHTFTNELELLGVQTLLAYDNACFDMAGVFYPTGPEDEWQNVSRTIFSNLTTYRHPFAAEDHLTATECDARLRTYLSLEYREAREDDCIHLALESDAGDGCCFLLRTHNETVVSVSGGSFKQLEEDAYLITAEEKNVEIRLASTLSALVDMEGKDR